MAGFSILGLPGPEFLALYAGVAGVTLGLSFLFIRAADPTRDMARLKVPSEPDAIALAYLSGGVNNVIRTLLFDLRQQGYVGIADERLQRAAGPQSGRVLDARSARVLMALSARPTPAELFADAALAADIERLCAPERRRLVENDLLAPLGVGQTAGMAFILGSIILLGLAASKLAAALLAGHRNVIFLIGLAAAAEIFLWMLTSKARKRIASARGTAYLAAIKRAYGRRLSEKLGQAKSRPAGAAAFDAGSLFLVSIFGYEALKGALEPEFMSLFRKSASDSSGSCGSSCSSGGGDGGGGCGGCGGGGD